MSDDGKEASGESTRDQELRALMDRLAVSVDDLGLVDRALTHASIACEAPEIGYDYESLEFLGDAALGLVVAHELFVRAPNRTPGEYTQMRAGLVNRRRLAQQAKVLGIAPMIRLGRGEELAGGRKRTALLADCLEALIGAIYLDQGWDAAHAFVARVFHEAIDQELAEAPSWDFKSRLQQHCQAHRFGLPEFRVVRSEGPDHRKRFEVEVLLRGEPTGKGAGYSKKEAEQDAARMALEHEGLHIG